MSQESKIGDEHDRMLTTSVTNFLESLGTILTQTKLAAGNSSLFFMYSFSRNRYQA